MGFTRLHNSYYYNVAHGVFFVFDVTCRSSFDSIQKWNKDFDTIKSSVNVGRNVSKILIGNKIDLVERRVHAHAREVSFDEALELAEELGMADYFEVGLDRNLHNGFRGFDADKELHDKRVHRAFETMARNILQWYVEPALAVMEPVRAPVKSRGGCAVM